MTGATPFLLAARLARREVRQRPWRTLLVALLVAVPVAGMTTAAAFVRTDHLTPEEEWRLNWAQADVVVDAADIPLPAGSRTTSWRTSWTGMRTVDGRRANADVTDMPFRDPVVGGVMQVLDGRAPVAAGEVFLTRALARRLGVGAGDTLSLERPSPQSYTVAGVGERRAWWGSSTIVLAPGTPFAWDLRLAMGGASTTTTAVDLPEGATEADVAAIGQRAGGVMAAPSLLPHPTSRDSGNEAVAWSWVIGAVVLMVVGIVIASAFAAGARRQLTMLGQLAANGGGPAVLRRVLFLQGTWAGAIGSLLGVVLGGVALVALAPHADRIFSRHTDAWDVRLGDLVPVVLLGVGAATVAAMVPARSTSRVPVLAALAGRRPLGQVPRWLTAAGLATVTAGLGLLSLAVLGSRGVNGADSNVWLLTAILGGMAVLMGTCAVTPRYTAVLEPLGTRLGGVWRFAARSLTRQRTRSSAVVAAVCASGALAVLASAIVLGVDAHNQEYRGGPAPTDVHIHAYRTRVVVEVPDPMPPTWRPDPPIPQEAPADLVGAVSAALPGSTVYRLTYVHRPEALDFPHDAAVVADEAALDVYRLPATTRRTLADAGMVRLGADWAAMADPGGTMGRDLSSAPTVDDEGLTLGSLPRLVVTPEKARELGLPAVPGAVLVRAPEALTDEQRETVAAIVEDYQFDLADAAVAGQAEATNVNVEWPFRDDVIDPLLLEALLTGLALVFTLFVVATGLALAAAETRDERDVLTVVGASPATMRSTSGQKALLLSVLGGVLAVPVGFLPVVVFTLSDGSGFPLVFPWRVVLLLVVAVPLVAAALTTAGSAVALRVRPVRISTMAFD